MIRQIIDGLHSAFQIAFGRLKLVAVDEIAVEYLLYCELAISGIRVRILEKIIPLRSERTAQGIAEQGWMGGGRAD